MHNVLFMYVLTEKKKASVCVYPRFAWDLTYVPMVSEKLHSSFGSTL